MVEAVEGSEVLGDRILITNLDQLMSDGVVVEILEGSEVVGDICSLTVLDGVGQFRG